MKLDKIEKFDKNKIVIPKELIKLSEIFESNGFDLYIVGGYIRDTIVGTGSVDVDICSNALPEAVETMLEDTPFTTTLINKKLGTLKICAPTGIFHFEHTTFRVEKYARGHLPENVKFVDDVMLDAARRDFTVNAIYFNVRTREIVDPYGGVEDCENRILKMVTPETFDVDGLRILRLLRFAYSKSFKIDEKTYEKAKWKAYLLKDISHDRIAQEIHAMARGSAHNLLFKYAFHCDHFPSYDILKAMFDFKILEYIFPEILTYIDASDFYKNLVFPDRIGELADYDFIVALVYLVIVNVEAVLGVEAAPELYTGLLGPDGLMLKKNQAERKWLTIDGLITLDKMYDESLFINYVQLYFSMLKDIKECRHCLYPDSAKDETYMRLVTTEKLMVANNIPRNMREVDLTAEDIMKEWPDLPQHLIGQLLELAFLLATHSGRNEREYLLKELEKMINATKGEIE